MTADKENATPQAPPPEVEVSAVLGLARANRTAWILSALLAGGRAWWLAGSAAAALVAGAAGYRLLAPPPDDAPLAARPVAVATVPVPPAKTDASAPGQQPADRRPDHLVASEGVSWATAEKAYADKSYQDALAMYQRLLGRSASVAANRRITDFLLLRLADCHRQLGQQQHARQAFQEAAESTSPIVRAVACYRLGMADAAEGQHLAARMQAYRAMAALGAVDWRLALEGHCEFLAARAITLKVLSLVGGELPAPPDWGQTEDPLTGLTEPELRRRLDEGSDRLCWASLGPRVERPGTAVAGQWAVGSTGAPLEEVLSRIVADAGVEVRYDGSVLPAVRRRPITLYLSGTTQQRAIEVACGAAGLVVRFTGNEAVVCDPHIYASVSAQHELLSREAVSAWRRLLMRACDDTALAYAHFALGTLHEQTRDAASALTEYRVLADRFAASRLAPLARLRISKIRLEMRDYAGARDELLDLLNRYPQCPAIDEVYLRLGQATMEAGLLDEAIRTFKKLYFLELSARSQAAAALGAAECYYRKGQYDEAQTWLARRIQLAQPGDPAELAAAHTLMAKTEAARGRFRQAVQSYRSALAADPKNPQRGRTLLELATILAKQDDFVAALGILENLGPHNAPPEQTDEILIMKADILRSMGLPEKAATMLQGVAGSAATPAAAARMTIVLARCLADSGDLDAARQTLADSAAKMPPGPLAHRALLDLADLCIRSNRPAQAVAACKALLASPCPDDVRRQGFRTLGRAYACQQDYLRAALALGGVVPDGHPAPSGGTKPTKETPTP